MLNPFKKLIRGIKERGIKGVITQIYMIGDLKFGALKGQDYFGNKYYQDDTAPFGQHRWVEYADIHNFDASMIQPDWHGWMHHMYDEVPGEEKPFEYRPTDTSTHAPYNTHVGLSVLPPIEQLNKSQYRQRGYMIGSLKTAAGAKDEYYMQPGHPLSDRGGRFQHNKAASGEAYKLKHVVEK